MELIDGLLSNNGTFFTKYLKENSSRHIMNEVIDQKIFLSEHKSQQAVD